MNHSLNARVLGLLLSPWLLCFASVTHAQCQPTAATNGDDNITCTGVDNDGVRTFAGTDTVTVEQGAQVTNSGAAAIDLGAGVGDTAVNGGSISTTGDNANGILGPFAHGNSSMQVITNNGTIETAGERADAIRGDGAASTLTNNGTIETTGRQASAVLGQGDGSSLTNSATGSIRTGGTGANGLEGNADSITATNAGSIITTGNDGDGIDILADLPAGDNITVVNSGTVETSGDDADGITANGQDSVIRNEGSIVTHGGVGTLDVLVGPQSFAGADGIVVDGDNTSIINAGTVTTTGSLGDGIIARGNNLNVLNALGASITVDASTGSHCIFAVNAPGATVTNNGTLNCDGGTAVQTGVGDDNLFLGSESVTNGDLLLNGGDDSANLTGNAIINGNIDGGPDLDRIVLDGGAGASGVVNGNITRFESLDKNGAGAFTLNGNAQVGQANINAGTLNLVGTTLDGNATVDNGAELDVQNTTVTGNLENNGLLDSNAGPLQVNGDFVQGPNGELQVQVGSPSVAATDVNAGGSANLDGTVTVDYQGAPENVRFGDTTLPVVTAAGGRDGEFAAQNIDGAIQGNQFGSVFTSQVIYDDDQALLLINRASDFDNNFNVGGNSNLNRVQTSTAGAFDESTANNDVTDEFGDILADVNNLDSSGQLQVLQTAGLGTHDDLAEVSRFLTRQVQSSLGVRLRRLCANADARSRQTTDDDGYCSDEGLWLQVYGQHLDQDNDHEGFLGYDGETYGAAVGNDWAAGIGYLGFSAGWAQADIDFKRNGGGGDIDTYYFAGYSGVGGQAWYANANLIFARHEYHEQRNIFIGADRSSARSEHDADEWAANGELGYDLIQHQSWRLTPFGALEYSLLDEERYNESGAGALNQRVQGRNTDALRTDLGLRLSGNRAVGANLLSAWASAAWSHDYDIDDRRIQATFVGAPNTRFSVDGRDIDEDGATTELGLSFGDARSYRISVLGQGEFRDRLTRLGAQLRFTKLF